MPRVLLFNVCILSFLVAACSPSEPTTAGDSSAVESGAKTVDAAPEPVAEPESTLPPLQLFDTTLKGAPRTALRTAIKQGGMRAKRENDNFWTDTYDPRGVLQGASAFEVGYVDATETFAFAEYTFSSFMDTQQVQRVADLVTQKYGEPTWVDGNVQVGDVVFRWERDDGMSIRVSRGWPSTTTFLSFVDEEAFSAMQAEQNAQDQAQQAAKAREQSQAF